MTVTLTDPSRLDPFALYFVDEYQNTVNTAIFGQGLVSHFTGGAWWQYAAWYGADTFVRVARKDPDGGWQTVTLPMQLTDLDSHNTLALGISASDGRLHVCAGAHAGAMSYTRTAADMLDVLPTWDALLFEAPSSTLAGTVIGNMTYPTFTAKPDGGLLFWYRNGGSSNGRLRLASYNGAWTLLGDVTSSTGTFTAWNGGQSTTRGFYWAPPLYDSAGTLHMVGTWRESAAAVACAPGSPILNHHTVYMYSDDDGWTWLNNAGVQVAETGIDPLSVADTTALVDAGTDTRYALQVPGMALGPEGLVGYLPDYVRGGLAGGCVNDEAERVAKTGQHPRWRDPVTGVWTARTVKVAGQDVFCEYPSGRAGRGHLVFGPSGAMHVFMSGFRVYSATPPSYNDWALSYDGTARLNAFGEAQIDRSREGEGIVSFLYSEQSSGVSGPVCVREFTVT